MITPTTPPARAGEATLTRGGDLWDEKACLQTDPFAGDFGESDDITFVDKMTNARKAGPCHCCAGTIKPGERIRRRVDKFDGQMMTFRWCEECCKAMAASSDDGGEAWTERERLRERRLKP